MAKKAKNVVVMDKRVYPVKVRLRKPNRFNQDKIVYHDIVLTTFHDTLIESADKLGKLNSIIDCVSIKSDVVASEPKAVEEKKEEVVNEKAEQPSGEIF